MLLWSFSEGGEARCGHHGNRRRRPHALWLRDLQTPGLFLLLRNLINQSSVCRRKEFMAADCRSGVYWTNNAGNHRGWLCVTSALSYFLIEEMDISSSPRTICRSLHETRKTTFFFTNSRFREDKTGWFCFLQRPFVSEHPGSRWQEGDIEKWECACLCFDAFGLEEVGW